MIKCTVWQILEHDYAAGYSYREPGLIPQPRFYTSCLSRVKAPPSAKHPLTEITLSIFEHGRLTGRYILVRRHIQAFE
jgi:hypothetical protein